MAATNRAASMPEASLSSSLSCGSRLTACIVDDDDDDDHVELMSFVFDDTAFTLRVTLACVRFDRNVSYALTASGASSRMTKAGSQVEVEEPTHFT